MSDAPNPVIEAERDAQVARQRVMSTWGALQHRLRPARLMADASDGAKAKAGRLLDSGVSAAKARPATLAAIALGAVAFVFRREIFGLLRGLRGAGEDSE